MRHVLCAYLRYWPIERLRRHRPELRHEPLVLVETAGNRRFIVHVSPETPGGIHSGMMLAQAKARHAGLLHRSAAPEADRRGLEALGHWLMRFSPDVCADPPFSIFLDATGLERLYGGLDGFGRRVAQALAGLRLTASVVIAPSPGAAWALAAFGSQTMRVVSNEQLTGALSPLPPEALRLEDGTVSALSALGVQTIGSLLELPRNDLAIRFGSAVLMRIDQASGAMPEPLAYLTPRSPIEATLEFEGEVESLQAIHWAVGELAGQVAARLGDRGLGARELRLGFRRPYAEPIEKTVRLMRPSHDGSALARLLRCAMEDLTAEGGFVGMSLAVVAAQRMGDEQGTLIGNEQRRNDVELKHLIECLRARLDRAPQSPARPAVEWGELVESHLPEKAIRCREIADKTGSPGVRGMVDLLRPFCLLPRPRPIQVMVRPSDSRDGRPISFTDRGQVHRLHHVHGPERITGLWWNGRWKTRDYFDALDDAGNRYWVFRAAPAGQWFLQGIFE